MRNGTRNDRLVSSLILSWLINGGEVLKSRSKYFNIPKPIDDMTWEPSIKTFNTILKEPRKVWTPKHCESAEADHNHINRSRQQSYAPKSTVILYICKDTTWHLATTALVSRCDLMGCVKVTLSHNLAPLLLLTYW